MQIRRAVKADIPQLARLLLQVQQVHVNGRPDLFRSGARKYTDAELEQLLEDPSRPVYVAEEQGAVLGYAFCIHEIQEQTNSLFAKRTLYIDDLCVDESCRGRHIGTALYDHVVSEARNGGFDRITLNVWALNDVARAFYESRGLHPLKTTMEQKL